MSHWTCYLKFSWVLSQNFIFFHVWVILAGVYWEHYCLKSSPTRVMAWALFYLWLVPNFQPLYWCYALSAISTNCLRFVGVSLLGRDCVSITPWLHCFGLNFGCKNVFSIFWRMSFKLLFLFPLLFFFFQPPCS